MPTEFYPAMCFHEELGSISFIASSWVWEGCFRSSQSRFLSMLSTLGLFIFSSKTSAPVSDCLSGPLLKLLHFSDVLRTWRCVLTGYIVLDMIQQVLTRKVPWLVAVLLVMQPGITLAVLAARECCWLRFDLLSDKTCRSFPVAPQPVMCCSPQPVLFIPSQLQDFALILAECWKVPVHPFLEHVCIPLCGKPALGHIGWVSQFSVFCRLCIKAYTKRTLFVFS